MGLFDIFKKKDKKDPSTTDNGIPGPTFLDGLTEHIAHPHDLQKHEWRRTLKAASGQRKFKIRFYGELHKDYPTLIVGTDFAPPLIFAVDVSTGQEILLFDGCKHGYNAMFCDAYSKEQHDNRPVTNFYKDPNGHETFGITVSTYNSLYIDDELSEEVDENGFIELLDGSKVELSIAKRNAYDTLQISGMTDNGDIVEIVSEELA